MPIMTIDEAVEYYVALRDKKSSIELRHKKELSEYSSTMNKLESFIKKAADKEGVSSFKTPKGTASLMTVSSCSVSDWDAILEHVKKNDLFELLNKSVSKTAVKEYIEASGVEPPGVKFSQMVKVQVRRPNRTS